MTEATIKPARAANRPIYELCNHLSSVEEAMLYARELAGTVSKLAYVKAGPKFGTVDVNLSGFVRRELVGLAAYLATENNYGEYPDYQAYCEWIVDDTISTLLTIIGDKSPAVLNAFIETLVDQPPL